MGKRKTTTREYDDEYHLVKETIVVEEDVTPQHYCNCSHWHWYWQSYPYAPVTTNDQLNTAYTNTLKITSGAGAT